MKSNIRCTSVENQESGLDVVRFATTNVGMSPTGKQDEEISVSMSIEIHVPVGVENVYVPGQEYELDMMISGVGVKPTKK